MPRLMLLSFTEPTDMPVCHTPVMPDMPMELTHMPMVLTTERDLLMLSQRLMLMLTMDTTDMPDLMLMVTTERDLLRLPQRLMPTTDTSDMPDLMPMVIDHTDTQLMPTTDTSDMPDLMPMVI